MPVNQLVPFAASAGSNVLSFADWSARAARGTGFANGVANVQEANTAWRQSSFVSAMIGQYTADISGNDVLDDANLAVFLANFKGAQRSNNPIYKQTTGTANALALAFTPALTSYAQMRLVVAVATAANTRADVTIQIDGLAARPILRSGGAKLRRGDIQPGPVLLVDNGSAYELFGRSVSARTPLTSGLTLFVATTGSDSANDGLDVAAPFLTISRALSEILNNYDLNGYVATIQVVDGTYTGATAATVAAIGASSGTGSIVIQGNAATPANVLVAVTGSNAFFFSTGAQVTIKDMKIQTAGAGTSCIAVGVGGAVAWNNVEFGSSVVAHVNVANGGFAQATGPYKVSGGAQYHIVASGFANVSVASRLVTITGTPNFSGAWAYVDQARIDATAATYSGGATGSRYTANNYSTITNGSGMPGNAVGTTNNSTVT